MGDYQRKGNSDDKGTVKSFSSKKRSNNNDKKTNRSYQFHCHVHETVHSKVLEHLILKI